jgi:hypothetical protein
MRLREKNDEERELDHGAPDDDSAAGNLRRTRLAGQSFLAAGADAIERALSGDSEKFLAATRQQGGQ